MWLSSLWLALSATCLEVGIPERFLKPRDFNPHAYTAAGQDDLGAVDLDSLPHPYALFVRPLVHRGESSTAPIQFPKVPDRNSDKPPARPAAIRIKPQRIINDDLSHIVSQFQYNILIIYEMILRGSYRMEASQSSFKYYNSRRTILSVP